MPTTAQDTFDETSVQFSAEVEGLATAFPASPREMEGGAVETSPFAERLAALTGADATIIRVTPLAREPPPPSPISPPPPPLFPPAIGGAVSTATSADDEAQSTSTSTFTVSVVVPTKTSAHAHSLRRVLSTYTPSGMSTALTTPIASFTAPTVEETDLSDCNRAVIAASWPVGSHVSLLWDHPISAACASPPPSMPLPLPLPPRPPGAPPTMPSPSPPLPPPPTVREAVQTTSYLFGVCAALVGAALAALSVAMCTWEGCEKGTKIPPSRHVASSNSASGMRPPLPVRV